MTLTYILSNALISDASAISSLFALSWQSPFSRLQFGNMEPHALASAMSPRVAQQIAEKSMLFMIARKAETGEVVSVAQWSVPTCTSPVDTGNQVEAPVSEYENELDRIPETPHEQSERQAFEDEIFLGSLPASTNRPLILEFTTRLRGLRQRILNGAPHYLLENLATHPVHRGRGLATRLMGQVLERADAEGVLGYLETGEENQARVLYGRLGFGESGREEIEGLERFGGEEGGEYVVVGCVRVPRGRKDGV